MELNIIIVYYVVHIHIFTIVLIISWLKKLRIQSNITKHQTLHLVFMIFFSFCRKTFNTSVYKIQAHISLCPGPCPRLCAHLCQGVCALHVLLTRWVQSRAWGPEASGWATVGEECECGPVQRTPHFIDFGSGDRGSRCWGCGPAGLGRGLETPGLPAVA